MNILFIGDVYGNRGREAVRDFLPSLKNKYKIDFVVGNCENATHGRGLSLPHYKELRSYGIDAITVGNHFFFRNESNSYFVNTPELIRPYNLISGTAGIGSRVFNVNGISIRVSSILCKVWMKDFGQKNIYQAMDELLEKEEKTNIHIVDIHGEATAEKIAFAHNYASNVSAILGTHTHVQTADEDIFDNHCGYISDVGMTGPYESVIGANIEQVIVRSKSSPNGPLDVSYSSPQFNAVLLEVDEEGKCHKIERINIRPGRDY